MWFNPIMTWLLNSRFHKMVSGSTLLLTIKGRKSGRNIEVPVNYIRDGKIREKFVYLLCRNDNCITRTITEDVPPKFYSEEGGIRCRYCRRPYAAASRKIAPDELGTYLKALPTRIEPVAPAP